MVYEFTIWGNQEGPGNPIPYHRTTQRARFTPEHRRYEAWKNHVVAAFLRGTHYHQKHIGTKPIKHAGKARLDAMIYWHDNTHGDPDNILKGINDALFVNDKRVACSVDFVDPDKKSPEIARVEVRVELL